MKYQGYENSTKKVETNNTIPDGYVWKPHRPKYNDPYSNFEKIRTIKKKEQNNK